MKHAALILVLLLAATAWSVRAAGEPYVGGQFHGRIAYSCDGNHNDRDDWIASPMTLAILAEASLKDRLVHFDYNCILPLTDPEWEKTHAQSVLGTAERYGFDKSRFFDCRQRLGAAVADIAKAINDSSLDNPLYFIIAGPMEVPYRGIQKSDPAKRRFVYCISHSRWNDGFASRYQFTFTKRSVIEQDVHWLQIQDQNRLLSTSPYGRAARDDEWRPYDWMRNSRDAKVRWLWERMLVSTRPDPSDAGMTWFLATGDEECDPQKPRRLLDQHQPPAPVRERQQVRIEAENFRDFQGFALEDRKDKSASHQLNVMLTGLTAGRIRTLFDEPFTGEVGRYDVDIRYLAEAGGRSRFGFLVNGVLQGAPWEPANPNGRWVAHTIPDLAIKRGDELGVKVEADGTRPVRLDYVQLNLRSERKANPNAVPTFESVGLYWKAPDGATNKVCEVSYRAVGDKDWRAALPLWFDARDQEYRGSIVQLRPGTRYEVALQLQGTTTRSSVQARTWSEAFPVGKTVGLPARFANTLTITDSGSPEAYALYAPAAELGSATIDVAGQSDHCIVVKASYVILRGLTLQNARLHGVLLGEGAHDVVIEDCDISGWGRMAKDGWGEDYDAAIYSKSESLKRVIVQRNRIHHPRGNSNNWQEARPRPGKREPTHPEGPQAVCFWDSDGNHVIRYNTVLSDDTHQYNDIFGAGHNFSTRGFPNRDSDIYGNLLSHCWDDAIESEGANCNVRVWGNYMTDVFVGVACASTSIGPLYVWRNVTGVVRESPTKTSGAFFKTSDKMGGGKIYVFHNTILQPASSGDSHKTLGAVVGLGWGGPMTNVMSRNNILQVTRQSIADRARCALNDFDYDLFSAPFLAADNQEKHGLRGVPEFVAGHGLREGRGIFALSNKSPGFDAGVVMPNFNDAFVGGAPDLGAQEAGSAPMEFGANAYRPHQRPGEKP